MHNKFKNITIIMPTSIETIHLCSSVAVEGMMLGARPSLLHEDASEGRGSTCLEDALVDGSAAQSILPSLSGAMLFAARRSSKSDDDLGSKEETRCSTFANVVVMSTIPSCRREKFSPTSRQISKASVEIWCSNQSFKESCCSVSLFRLCCCLIARAKHLVHSSLPPYACSVILVSFRPLGSPAARPMPISAQRPWGGRGSPNGCGIE
mmetsp:Transcript_31563/g.87007  ORF Transcript_31563/g.87007 Transcript_31563/m.87007 type:complete len:208 (+) Transcript_31563:1255-1878(+)